jgi:hypothetical protein
MTMLAKKVLEAYYPIGASKGKEYASIKVDSETYERMTFIGTNNGEAEFWDALGKVYNFNIFQCKIELIP